MGSQPPTYERHVDRDGVTRIQRKRTGSGIWLVWVALAFTVVCGVLSAWLVSSPGPVPDSETAPEKRVENASSPTPHTQRVTTPAPPSSSQAAPPQGTPAPTPESTPQLPPAAQEPSGPAEGINLYRPGAKPLKQGIIVPEDFELPPGYVRHYQATDNGERVKPILMFHPDHKLVDANGQPVELPVNRVVPPELAPPGMPIDILELPDGPEGVEPIP